MDIQGCKTGTSVYFLCICRCGGHKVYAKLKTNVDECVGPMQPLLKRFTIDKSDKQSQVSGIHSSSFCSESAKKHYWVNVKETLAQLEVVSTATENSTMDLPTGSSRNKSVTKNVKKKIPKNQMICTRPQIIVQCLYKIKTFTLHANNDKTIYN